MNKNLAIYIEEDYIIAAICPLRDKFELIKKRGNSIFPLYFLIDNISQKIDYGIAYKAEYKKQKEKGSINKIIVGDFINKITSKEKYKWHNYDNDIIMLLNYIKDDIKDAYFYLFRNKFEEQLDESNKIPLFLAFSDNIKPQSREILQNFFRRNNFSIEKQKDSPAELIAKFYLIRNKIPADNKKIAVIEAISNNLNISLVNFYNGYDHERYCFKSFPGYGNNPKVQVIAQKIVDDLNKQSGLLNSEKQKEEEYERHKELASKIVREIEQNYRPYINIKSNFLCAKTNNLETNIDVNEINKLTAAYIRQVSNFFEYHFLEKENIAAENLDKIILVGDNIIQDLVTKEFSRFGNNKLYLIHNNQIENILVPLFADVYTEKSAEESSINEALIIAKELKAGTAITLNNYDSRAGKGKSLQKLLSLGNSRFEIKQSTRSLMPGDIAISLSPVWAVGIQIDFEIIRAGKKIGKFRTRAVQKIDIETK